MSRRSDSRDIVGDLTTLSSLPILYNMRNFHVRSFLEQA